MAEIKRRDLVIGAGVAGAVGGAAVATEASGGGRRPLQIDVSKETPALPKDTERYSFPLASAKPTATTPGGTVTELTENNFPISGGNAAGVFFLVLKPGALREPHCHPNAWEMDYCVEGKGELGIVTPDGDQRIQTL